MLETLGSGFSLLEINAIESQRIREYLLGQLPGEQQSVFEERLLTDNVLYEELLIVEDELIDAYLLNSLSTVEREGFESHFLATPENSQKVRFARAFRKYVTANMQEGATAVPLSEKETVEFPRPETTIARHPKSGWLGFLPIRNPAISYAMAAALVLLVVGVTWVAWKKWPSGQRNPGQLLAVALTPGVTRDAAESGKVIDLPRAIDTLRLELLLSDTSFQSFEAILLDAEGNTLATQPNLRSEIINGQTTVVFDVAAKLMPAGDYLAKLNGISGGSSEPVGTYSFSVRPR